MPRETCLNCKGKKVIDKIDVMHARTVQQPCEACKGKGYIDTEPEKPEDGIRCRLLKADPFYVEKILNGNVLAWMFVLQYPLTKYKGRPLTYVKPMCRLCMAKKSIESEGKKPRGVMVCGVCGTNTECWRIECDMGFINAHIHDMQTLPKQRGKGYMQEILMGYMRIPEVIVIQTSWGDSSAHGRKLLMMFGFKREGSVLIWRRDEAIEEAKKAQGAEGEQRLLPVTPGSGEGAVGEGGTAPERVGENSDRPDMKTKRKPSTTNSKAATLEALQPEERTAHEMAARRMHHEEADREEFIAKRLKEYPVPAQVRFLYPIKRDSYIEQLEIDHGLRKERSDAEVSRAQD
jgi:hypothetical protein